MELIVTEKENVARRIADILSDGTASTEQVRGETIYKWGGKRVIGLSGHVVGVDFTEEYSDWTDVEPADLIDAEVVKRPTQESIVNALQALAEDADRVTIATDYDREGELIGKEAYELVRGVNQDVPIDRVRFSSITENEVTEAFANPDSLDFDLAEAGEARQIIDLMWGAALTRFLSLAAKQYGDDFISVGRVQSPTLRLIVDREREIEAFEPDDYWELFTDLAKTDGTTDPFEAQYFYLDESGNEAERIWNEDDAEAAFEDLSAAATADITEVSRRTRTDRPPAPFNTTQFIRAAGAIGYSAKRGMSLAEDLYTAGYITYPRTDNTVYPDDLNPEELISAFANTRTFGEDATDLLQGDGTLTPTRGDTQSTDHPPIHPTTDIPDQGDLTEDQWNVYELVVRRFFATVAEPATWEHLRVVAEGNGRSLKANGKRLLELGYHAVYPYFNTSENFVPDVEEGEILDIADIELEAKQTEPPRRYGQSRLIELMEDLGIGTKCLTSDTKILVREDDGDVRRRPVEELFDEGQVVMADGDTDIAVTEQGPTTLSFDETAFDISSREQTLVSRRPLDEEETIYQVRTETGSFSATDDHPVYVWEDGFVVKPLSALSAGDELVSSRGIPAVEDTCDDVIVTWEEFADAADKSTKLYGTGCNDDITTIRSESGDSQAVFAERFGTYHDAIWRFENGQRDVPVWLLGEFGLEPDRIHGLNTDLTFDNPFPITWSPALARVLANLLGDGSIHVSEAENSIDVRYHNTDPRLIDRFVTDIDAIFGVSVTASGRPGRESHHKRRYQVQLPGAVSRVLLYVLDAVSENNGPGVPSELGPAFVGALFDDEGLISTDGKAFISNTDHDLLRATGELLEELGIDSRLDEGQHKLYIHGRRNLERFLDRIPIASDEKFYRGLSRLDHYPVTERKAVALEHLSGQSLTSEELAERLDVSVSVARSTIRELTEDGYIDTHIEGSNHSLGGNRIFRYSSEGFEQSIFATLRNRPSTVRVQDVTERSYDGPVYDLTIDESAPNFAVEGGAIVHNSTRHNTIDKLYDRGYIENDPPRPTQLAQGVVTAAEEYADMVVSEAMTAQLEEDMTAIANGEASLEEITDESRGMLERIFEELEASEEEIGEQIREALKADKALGPCPECGERLLIRKSRYGSHFVGCDGYPDCEYTLPLPNKGEPLLLDEVCEDHGLKHVKMLAGRGTFVHGCPQCQADEADEEDDEIIGVCPDCGEDHGGELAIKRVRSGSRLVGCTRYPDCDYSLPLPRRGDIEVTDTYCEEHDLPELIVHNDDDEPWELGCPICNYEEYTGQREAEEEETDENELKSIKGIGAKTAEKLETVGIETVTDLTDADVEAIADDVEGISVDRLRDWQARAEG